MVAEVIINRTAKKLNRVFDYNIPKNMEDFVIIGSRVLVPFGKSKKIGRSLCYWHKGRITV